MKQFKKSLSIVLIVMMLLTSLGIPLEHSHAKTDETDPNFKFIANYIQGYEGGNPPKNLVIPAEIDGKRVIGVSSDAFRYSEIPSWQYINYPIESLVIEEGVEDVRTFAFSGNNLKTVTIPASMKIIGDHTFRYNKQLKEVIFAGENLTSIERLAFSDCIELGELKALPSSLKKIEMMAFENTKLSKVELPEGLEEIEGKAFMNCMIEEVSIPNSVKVINASPYNANSQGIFYMNYAKDTKKPEDVRLTKVFSENPLVTPVSTRGIVNPVRVTVKYQDEAGSAIRDDQIIVGYEHKKFINENNTPSLAEGDGHIYSDYMMPYADEALYDNDELFEEFSKNYFSKGDQITIPAEEINGYTKPENVSVDLDALEKEVVLVYKRESNAELTLEGEGLRVDSQGPYAPGTSVTVNIDVPQQKEIDTFIVNGEDHLTQIKGLIHPKYTFTISKDTKISITYKDTDTPYENEFELSMDDKSAVEGKLGDKGTLRAKYRGKELALDNEEVMIQVNGTQLYTFNEETGAFQILEAGDFTVQLQEANRNPVVLAELPVRLSPVKVRVRVEDSRKTICEPDTVEIKKLKIEAGVDYYTNINFDKPTVFHALLEIQRKNNLDITHPNVFDADENGNWLFVVGGVEPASPAMFMYAVNHKQDITPVGQKEIKDDDYVVVFKWENSYEAGYSFFTEEEASIEAGEKISLPLSWLFGSDTVKPYAGAKLVIDDVVTDVLSTDDGMFDKTFEEPGVYHISAIKENDKGEAILGRPYLKLTVTEKTLPPAEIETLEIIHRFSWGPKTELKVLPEQTIPVDDVQSNTYISAKSSDPEQKIMVTYTDWQNNVVTEELGDSFKFVGGHDFKDYTVTLTLGDKTYRIIKVMSPTITKATFSENAEDHELIPRFSWDKKEYELKLFDSTETVELDLKTHLKDEFKDEAQQVITVNNEVYNGKMKLNVKDKEKIVVRIENKLTGRFNTYTFKLTPQETKTVTFHTNPESANVVLRDDKNVLVPNLDTSTDNVFKYRLLAGHEYNYYVSAKGYVSKSDTFIAKEENIGVQLEKAAETNFKDLPAYWPQFRRDQNNNAVVDTFTARDITESRLKWGTRIGTGWGMDDSVSSPIIVNGKIFVTKGSTLQRINKETGDVEKIVETKGAGGYTVHPSYGGGLIYIPVGGGAIQAFNAETMESVWVSEKVMGEQTLTPLYYHDGYLYTGSWIGGSKARGHFFALDVTDEDPSQPDELKKPTWIMRKKGGFYWAGAVAQGDYLFFGSDQGILYAVNRFNGKIADSIKLTEYQIRGTITQYNGYLYFTSKGNSEGCFVYKMKFDPESKRFDRNDMIIKQVPGTIDSTSTPAIHNGRLYIGGGATGGFASGSVAVLHADTLDIAYVRQLDDPTMNKGYPQSSALVTTAYGDDAYAYFTYNYTPGGILSFTDAPEQTEGVYQEVFIPQGDMSQYCICSIISDEDGTMYYKNDSGYIMAVERIHTITEVVAPEEIVLPVYYEKLTLPDSIVLKADNGTEHIVNNITWEGAVAKDVAGEYTLKTSFEVPDGYKYKTDTIEVEQKVRVVPAPMRFSGKDRFFTARAASMFAYEQSDNVILVNGHTYPDALSASVLAKELKAPILLTNKDNLPFVTAVEMQRLQAKKVYIIGGVSAVSQKVENELSSFFDVERIGGVNRYQTSVNVAKRIGKLTEVSGITIANGNNYADALSSTPLAIEKSYPIILIPKASVPQDVKDYIENTALKNAYIIGGKAVVEEGVQQEISKDISNVQRLAGTNRFMTAKVIANQVQAKEHLVLAKSDGFVDALVAGTLIASQKYNGPLMLTTTENLHESVQDYITEHKNMLKSVFIMGGSKAISEGVEQAIVTLLK